MSRPRSLPTIHLDAVYHVGTMSPADLGRNSGSGSLEGHCLSVSLCPHAWRRIARLGGNGLFELTADGGAFLDAIGVLDDPAFPGIVEWGISQGLVERQERWRAWTYDDESEEWRYMLCETRDDALGEVAFSLMLDVDDEEVDTAGPDGGSPVECVTALVATPLLEARCGTRYRESNDATDGLLIAWVDAETSLDGLWWDETFDPEALSAPRGGILPGRLDRWKAKPVDFDSVEDMEGAGYSAPCVNASN